MPAKPFVPPVRASLPALPPQLDEPPLLEPEAPPAEVALQIALPEQIPAYEAPRAKSKRVRHGPPPVKDEHEGEEETTPATDEPAPQLVQMLSPAQRKEYEQVIDQNVIQAQRSLSAVSARTLSTEQKDSARLIAAFIRQALESREQDPIRARSLAERASVLAQHLEKSFR